MSCVLVPGLSAGVPCTDGIPLGLDDLLDTVGQHGDALLESGDSWLDALHTDADSWLSDLLANPSIPWTGHDS